RRIDAIDCRAPEAGDDQVARLIEDEAVGGSPGAPDDRVRPAAHGDLFDEAVRPGDEHRGDGKWRRCREPPTAPEAEGRRDEYERPAHRCHENCYGYELSCGPNREHEDLPS